MELDRKAFHFDLDNKSVERFYTGKKNPWSDIQDFLESHCFEKPQYSGYESAENIVMSYQRAYGTVDKIKELHFDLGTAALSENYNSIRPNAWRGAWSLIRIFMERNGFIHTQYSGYESIAVMPIDKAMAVMEKLQQRYPWFKDSLLAASVTEVGERHDALSYIKGSHGIIVPVPAHSLEREEPDFFGSEIGDMKSATAELSKRNGLEPPKDLNRAH